MLFDRFAEIVGQHRPRRGVSSAHITSRGGRCATCLAPEQEVSKKGGGYEITFDNAA